MAKKFGGDWTQRKLDVVENYLKFYLTALNKQRDWASLGYIDAFAGDGSIEVAGTDPTAISIFENSASDEIKGLIAGSAQRALALEPGFDGYVFIETDPSAADRLDALADLRGKTSQSHPGYKRSALAHR